MTVLLLIFILALLGTGETFYLIRQRLAGQHPFCPIGKDCGHVLSSKYNKLLFIHNDVLGLLGHLGMVGLTVFIFLEAGPVYLWIFLLKLMISAAALMAFILFYLQWRVLKQWCFWCLMAAFNIWTMGLILLFSASI